MGYIRHDALLIVVGLDKGLVAEIEAFREEMPDSARKHLLGPVYGVNAYVSYALIPDGSKEGWGDSDQMDEWRERLLELVKNDAALENGSYPVWVHLQFGGDDAATRVVETADSEVYGPALPQGQLLYSRPA